MKKAVPVKTIWITCAGIVVGDIITNIIIANWDLNPIATFWSGCMSALLTMIIAVKKDSFIIVTTGDSFETNKEMAPKKNTSKPSEEKQG